ncbi:S100P-binding protein-like [Hyla sarda]|uniref:S100P-binding protein-like n=1 Tax=Hyla sarda TaxID=327740 RepID=UPI0024C360D8|nr:S100P-binding protein-like [Hyla sarda]XP_056412533.1 S100P-binding protein-like [Hyla sarda]XP_056412534.1 S100P-binding protein-like [Hyla sarda]XP_056412535.1 S100P-binding protein-like [Hyla sarda]XP_056412536.1 S100P-binding protein-like [Hyla sarda]XP_056412537.1 S100P-binding protein-like [Hyla sarda]
MKGINNPPVPRAGSERQVLLYPTDWEEPLPGTMEEIKISIVNDRATGSKREREEDTAVTPCVKRSCHALFSCSTPISARTWATKSKFAKNSPQSPAWYPQGKSAEQGDEWDDSLLEPSDNEDDSELCLTLDEIETLLDDDDDDDSCYAAEPIQKCTEVTTCVVTFTPSKSENEGENGGDAPGKTLDISKALTEEPECEGDISNYAAMPPSPCHLAINPVEVTIPNQSTVSNVDSPPKFLIAETVIDCGLPTPLLDIKEVSTTLLPGSQSPKLPLHPSFSLSGADVAEEFVEDPDLVFDCDIDNLLAISPGDASSVEDDNSVILATITPKDNASVVLDSILPPQNLEPVQVSTAHATSSSTTDVAQDLSPLSLNTPDMPKDRHHHHPAEPEPLKEALPSTTSYMVNAEQNIFTDSSVTNQNVESQKLPEDKETKGMPNDVSTSRPKDPTTSAPRANDNKSKIAASSSNKAQGCSGPGKEKPQIAVAALPRPSFREVLSECELETMKNIYFNKVLMHIDSQGECNLEDPLYELASLQNQIGRENQNWQHPSDYTKRNHPRVGKKQLKRCSLSQWVTKNGGSTERFTSIPATFKRSPIPGALPFSS